MAGSAFIWSMTASTSLWVASADRCSWKDRMPTSSQSACFIATYFSLGPSSPTKTVPSPTGRPSALRRAARAASSISMRPASSAPSSSRALMVLLVTEVTLTGEHHDNVGLVGGVDDLLVPHRPARLDDRGDPGTGQ